MIIVSKKRRDVDIRSPILVMLAMARPGHLRYENVSRIGTVVSRSCWLKRRLRFTVACCEQTENPDRHKIEDYLLLNVEFSCARDTR